MAILNAMNDRFPLHRGLSMLRLFAAPWKTPLIGMALGLAYGIGEHLLDAQRHGESRGLGASYRRILR